jgi:hypothetical protein
MARAKPS